MYFKEKLEDLYDFNMFNLKDNDNVITVKIKKLTYKELLFIESYFQKLTTDEDLIDFVSACSNLQPIEIETISPDGVLKIIEEIASVNNIKVNSSDIYLDRLRQALINCSSSLTIFIRVLIGYGYKLLDLKNLSQKEIIDLCLEESLYRFDITILNNIELECYDINKKIKPGSEKLLNEITEIKDLMTPKEEKKNLDSAFDSLSAL